MGFWKRPRLSRQPGGTSLCVGIAILVVGVVLVLLGWLWEGTWEDVFIEVGAAAGVGGIVLLFKPRLMRQVDERATDVATKAAATTAEEIATSRTEGFERRLVKLESDSQPLFDCGIVLRHSQRGYSPACLGRVVREVLFSRRLLLGCGWGLQDDGYAPRLRLHRGRGSGRSPSWRVVCAAHAFRPRLCRFRCASVETGVGVHLQKVASSQSSTRPTTPVGTPRRLHL